MHKKQNTRKETIRTCKGNIFLSVWHLRRCAFAGPKSNLKVKCMIDSQRPLISIIAYTCAALSITNQTGSCKGDWCSFDYLIYFWNRASILLLFQLKYAPVVRSQAQKIHISNSTILKMLWNGRQRLVCHCLHRPYLHTRFFNSSFFPTLIPKTCQDFFQKVRKKGFLGHQTNRSTLWLQDQLLWAIKAVWRDRGATYLPPPISITCSLIYSHYVSRKREQSCEEGWDEVQRETPWASIHANLSPS